MTSGNPPAQAAPLYYTGSPLEKAGNRRTDPRWLKETLEAPDTRVIPLWRDRCLVRGASPAPVSLDAAACSRLPAGAGEPAFLGLAADAARTGDGNSDGDGEGHGVFAVDLSDLDEEQARRLTGADAVLDVRALVGTVDRHEAALLAYARGLLFWNRHQRFCGRCGAPAERRNGGHLRVCSGPDCGKLLFPRIEPAVIMVVESPDGERILLARHRNSTLGTYSTLAGFVEVGDSLEDAVRREVREETGVRVGEVAYVASQSWPFPAGLMLGFRATALDGGTDDITVDDDEVLEARWFTRAELAAQAADDGRLGRVDSIDQLLLHTWLRGDRPCPGPGAGQQPKPLPKN
ncbi:NAD(+) diphosphatase [Streptomyces bathyalis]|uniref:NAD(+) diphosphatase n=1 Tax=Streptomyces bathyalis TaxID=2710756 RepID=A0A7T1T8J6_9ACTN|nr:NAD(+) diphosphatase [Streptomyces bathyalis]QPP08384.1 NAD(+) diphosphatase [Streptomyces bathyalis]